MTISRETLAAWVDGELDPAEAARIAVVVEADPVLSAEAAMLRALRERLSAHFAPVLDEPLSERLTSLLAGSAEVIDLAAARQRVATKAAARPAWDSWLRYGGPAIAAALVLALVLNRPGASLNYAEGALVATLDSQLGGTQSPNAPVRILLSFANASGELCRGYSSDQQAGIACKDGSGWRIERKVSGTAAQSGDYRQAGSGPAELMAAIQDMAQGEPLDAAAEAVAVANGWRR